MARMLVNIFKVRSESEVAVRDYVSQNAVEVPYFAGENSCEVGAGFSVTRQGDKVCHFSEPVDNYPQLITAVR